MPAITATGASAPREEATALRDLIQRVALAEPHYGYQRVTVELGRGGVVVNHKRVLRLMLEDNLLCLRRRPFVPATTDSSHGWQVVPNLTHGIVLTGIEQLWVADITYLRMRLSGCRARRVQPTGGRWKCICRRAWDRCA